MNPDHSDHGRVGAQVSEVHGAETSATARRLASVGRRVVVERAADVRPSGTEVRTKGVRRVAVSLRGFVLATHPGPTAVVTALATGLAIGVGAPSVTVLLVAAAVLTGQLSVGWSNDWVDAARDLAVHRAAKPVVRGLVSATALRAAAVAAVAACTVLSLMTGVVPGLAHLAAVASAWAYNLRLKGTVLSWLPYAVSFSLLLVFVVRARPDAPEPPWWGLLAAALLGIGAHVANVLPDLEDDRATGVRGLPHRLGHSRATAMALTTLVAASSVVVLGPARPPSAVTLTGGAVAVALSAVAAGVALTRPRSVWPFRLSMAVAATCVALLVAAGPDLLVASGAVTP